MLVNTMPEKTMEAVFDHGIVPQNSITQHYSNSEQVLSSIEALGVSIDDVTNLLEQEGVDKFVVSWTELVESISQALKEAN
jgi:transaldolase